MSEDLLKRILYLIGALIVFRLGTHIVIPFISQTALASLVEDNRTGILGMMNMFSGGALERLSIFTLGIMPYISSSIIMNLMTSVVPRFEQLKKEGERGRRTITQYTRMGTVLLAVFQSYGISIALQSQTGGGVALVTNPGLTFSFVDGDDGYYQAGGSSVDYQFTDAGTLIDKVTGLEWQNPEIAFEANNLFDATTLLSKYSCGTSRLFLTPLIAAKCTTASTW